MVFPRYISIRQIQELGLLVFLTLLALVTRVYGIWDWSLVGDEYYTVRYASERSSSIINPAQYVLVLGSIKLFGLTEWSVRLPSVILGSLSIPIFYVACRSMLNRKTAIIGSIFLIFCSWHLYHSQLSRYYCGVFVFGTLSFFLYYRALQKDSWWLLGGAFFSNVLGILFHATSVIVLVPCALYSVFILLWKTDSKSEYSKRVAKIHLIICGTAGLFALPFFFQVLQLWQFEGGALGSGPIGVLLQLIKNLDIVLAVSSFFGLMILLQKDRSKGIYFALAIGIPLVALLIGSVLTPPVRAKYIFYTLPLIIALSAFLCAEISSVLSRFSFAKNVVAFLVIAGMMPSFVSYYTGKSTLDVSEALEFLSDRYTPGDKIIVFSDAFNYLLTDYPNEDLRIFGAKQAWKKALTDFEDGDQRVWIILDTYRNSSVQGLEAWLMEYASLIWRKYEKRYDYSIMGYEIYLVNGP